MIREGFAFYRPCERLRPYVRYYWTFETKRPASAMTFPTGCPQIIFHRKSALYIPELDVFQDRLTVSGQVNFSSHISTVGDTETIVAVFHPHAMSLFLGIPASLLYNRETSGYDLGNAELDALAAQIFDSSDTVRCIGLIERWLLHRIACITPRLDDNARRIGSALRTLYAAPRTSVGELSASACLCRKQFERIFNAFVGMNPKEYAQIVRLQRALALMQRTCRRADYAQIACTSGYADQSHFTREFRRFTGHTPASLYEICEPYSDLFSDPLS